MAEAAEDHPAVAAPSEAVLQNESLEKSEVVTKDLMKAQAQQPAPGTAPAAPGTAPAPGARYRTRPRPAAPAPAPAAPGTPQ